MSHAESNVTLTGVFAGSFASSGSAMSSWCPFAGGHPKSLPDPDHHTDLPLAAVTWSPVSSTRPGSFATYASPLWIPLSPLAALRVYGVPPAVTQSIEPMSYLESRQFAALRCPGCRTRGTIQPSSCLLNPSMCCDLSVAMMFQSPYVDRPLESV